MIQVTLTDPLPLSVTLEDGASGLFPQAVVRDTADAIVTTQDLTEIGATGRYTNTSFTTVTAENVTAHIIIYTDSGHTIEAVFHGRVEENFIITDGALGAGATADAVWDEVTIDHETAGTFGEKVSKKLLTFIKFLATK